MTTAAGLCRCGCGRPTTIAKETDHRDGRSKGLPVQFISGHHSRRLADERLWSKAQKAEGDGCWLWTGSKAKGYGQIRIEGRLVAAHRLAWELTNGPIPPGLKCLHRCDVRACIRPDHLFVDTQAKNVADMVAKGRNRCGDVRGERHGLAKLTTAKVLEFRRLKVEGSLSQRALARRFGISRSAGRDILAGRSWAWLKA